MTPKKVFDVALSFAGEDRSYAQDLANALDRRGVKVFYDKYEQATLWGKNLYTHLSDLYQNRARYCVMLISKHYAAKLWPNLEREAAQARAFHEHAEYILPVRLDNTEIRAVLPTIGYIRWPPENAETIADKIMVKLGKWPDAALLRFYKACQQVEELAHQFPPTGELLKAGTLRELYINKSQYSPSPSERIVLFRNLLLQGTGKRFAKRGQKLDTAASDDSIGALGWYWFSEIDKNHGLQLIREASHYSNQFVRTGAARALGVFGNTTDRALLRDLMDDKNPNVVSEAIKALANLGSPDDINSIRGLHDSRKPAIRWGVVYALGKCGTAEDEALAFTLLEDHDSNVRREAVRAIDSIFQRKPQIKEKAISELTKIVQNPDQVPQVGKAARDLLKKLHGEDYDSTLQFEKKVRREMERNDLCRPWTEERSDKAFELLFDRPGHRQEASIRWMITNERDKIDTITETYGRKLHFRVLQRSDYFLYCPKWWLQNTDNYAYSLVCEFR